ncbi:hypothetical protein OO184_11960 [Photorhabdus sp. APURE]|uniref:hypothetical protein n=1 Tax=Photorhabdus aballayi TaxID=2991723 RepID=UPI00223D1799|nr:hypothetical protein [Photorhabdus aballayi]MCW7548634.1 hypothetical protein [Photorhabdus aballayi]
MEDPCDIPVLLNTTAKEAAVADGCVDQMVKRIVWKSGDLVNIKLRDNLYTIGQMLTSPAMRFYNICNMDGIWKDVDLNDITPLFRVFVGNVINKYLVQEKIKDKSVILSSKPYEPYWIKPYSSMDVGSYLGKKGDFLFMGGKLIDLGPDGNISVT